MNMATGHGALHVSRGRGCHRIHHHVTVESLGKCADCGDDRFLIARHARDQGCFADAVTIQLLHPRVDQSFRVLGGQLPAQQGRKRVHRSFLLLGQSCKESMRKEMDVCVGYSECAPGRLHHWPCSSGTGTGKRVMPAANATWVSPATLLTPSFFIMV